MASQEQVTQLVERFDRDNEFAAALESNPLGALRQAGFDDWAVTVEQERDRIARLVDEIYRDDAFRRAVEEDPSGKLGDWGLPEIAIESLLLVAGAPEDVVDRATADVEAHLSLRKPATAAALAAVLGTLAFAQEASAASPAASAQMKPAATSQVAEPSVSSQVAQPALTAQVKRAVASSQARPAAVSSQAKRATKASWYGVETQRVQLRGSLAALLGAQSTLR
jgi:hypothetical protein